MSIHFSPGDDPETVAAKSTPDVAASSHRRRAIADYLKSLGATGGLTVECDPHADTAYIVQDDYEEAPTITIPGRELPVHTHDVAPSVGTRLVQYGLALHEHGHDRYSPGPLMKELFDRQSFALPLDSLYWSFVNLFEDARVESAIIAEEGRWAEQRLIFTHLNFTFAQPEDIRNPEAVTWQTALRAAAAHFGKGQEKGHIIPTLVDATDDTLQWRSDRDKQLYYWVLPGIKTTLDDVTTEPDGEEAVKRMLEFVRKLDTTLHSLAGDPPQDDRQQRNSVSNETNDQTNDMGGEKEQPSSLDDSDASDSQEMDADPSTGGDGSPDDESEANEDATSGNESDENAGDDSEGDGSSCESESEGGSERGDDTTDDSQDVDDGRVGSDGGGRDEGREQQTPEGAPENGGDNPGQSEGPKQPTDELGGSSETSEDEREGVADSSDNGHGGEDTASGRRSEPETDESKSIGNGGGSPAEPAADNNNHDRQTGEKPSEGGSSSACSDDGEGNDQLTADEPLHSAESDQQKGDSDHSDAVDESAESNILSTQSRAGDTGAEDNADTISKALIDREKRKSTHEERQVERDKEELVAELERLQTAIGAGGGDISHLTIADTNEHEGSSEVWERIKSEAKMLKGPLQTVLQQTEQTEFRRGTHTGRFDAKLSHRLAVNNLAVNQVEISGDEKRYSVIVVLDRSASMRHNIVEAEVAATGFAMALEELDIDVAIVDLYQYEARMVKPFPSSIRTKQDILTSGAVGGGTPLTDALVVSRERVRQEPNFPFMFVVSDGKPFESDRYQDELEATNFPVLGVTLGDGTTSKFDDYYDVARSATPDTIGDELINLATEIMF